MSSEMASGEEGLGVTGDVSAKAIIGNRVYVIEGEWDKTASFNTVAEDWTRVGSVQDIVISDDGGIAGIVAEVGGFLGIGDKFVLLESGEAKLVPLEVWLRRRDLVLQRPADGDAGVRNDADAVIALHR
ncbi:PRC-barrel domain-containing protein [Sagittula sp. P11]|uniref:PRC-barrel domain-containing protein n=1 Tax=Sagittula sp. P11 TaxID=2009329 RepID=UPI0020C7B7F1|nr:PRC-barrel domain-containing protein [Sagittula sp. P11]